MMWSWKRLRRRPIYSPRSQINSARVSQSHNSLCQQFYWLWLEPLSFWTRDTFMGSPQGQGQLPILPLCLSFSVISTSESENSQLYC